MTNQALKGKLQPRGGTIKLYKGHMYARQYILLFIEKNKFPPTGSLKQDLNVCRLRCHH